MSAMWGLGGRNDGGNACGMPECLFIRGLEFDVLNPLPLHEERNGSWKICFGTNAI